MSTPVKESRVVELRLPSIQREEIARMLSGIALPAMRLRSAGSSKVDLPKVELPKVDLPTSDTVRKVVDDATAKVASSGGRSRKTMVAGFAIVAGLLTYAFTRPAVRDTVERSARKARERIDEMRAERERVAIEADDVATPVAADAWADPYVAAPVSVAGGSTSTEAFDRSDDVSVAFEEAETTNPV